MNIKHGFKTMTILCSLFLFIASHHNVQAEYLGISLKPRPFISKDDDYKRLMGLTAGLGKIETENNKQGVSLYANAYMFWFNFSLEYQDFDDRSVTNTYTGLGLGRYLQIQYGYGDEGYLVRARSEFEVIGKVTLFIARERYRDKPEFDNYSVGIGYNF